MTNRLVHIFYIARFFIGSINIVFLLMKFSLLEEFSATYPLHISVHVSIADSSPMAQQVFDCHSRSLASQSEVTFKYVGQLGVPVKTEVKIKFNSSAINIQKPFGLYGVWSRYQIVFISTYTPTIMLPPYFLRFLIFFYFYRDT